jgi:AraC-like DNA-binding protein/mannose-6-phosphate isomerase-like protein (cupin superfamily)
MGSKFTRAHLKFRDNLFFFMHRAWEQKNPDEYYHSHEGMEFLYLHEGRGQLILNDRLYVLKPRTLVYFQPYQVHLIRYEVPRLRSLIKVKLPLVKKYLHMFSQLADFVSLLENTRSDQQLFQLTPGQDAEINHMLDSIQHRLSTVTAHEQKEQFIIFLMQYLSYLKEHICTGLSRGESGFSPRQSNHAEKIVEWINEHYREPFCLDKLSANMHLSASYVSNLFRNCTGSTITEYMMRRRLDESRVLLATTSMSIDQVGKRSGFPNAAYFSRCFKKQYRVTPQQYRTMAVNPPIPLRQERYTGDG